MITFSGAAEAMPTQAWNGARRILVSCEGATVSVQHLDAICAALKDAAAARTTIEVVLAEDRILARGDVRVHADVAAEGRMLRVAITAESLPPRGEGGESAVAVLLLSDTILGSAAALRSAMAAPLDQLLPGQSSARIQAMRR